MNQVYKLKSVLLSVCVLAISFYSLLVSATGQNNSTASSYLIINNINGATDKGVYTNMRTGDGNSCTKTDALVNTNCNSLNLGNNELQIVDVDKSGNLINQIGVNNSNATSYENYGTENQLKFFEPGKQALLITKYRKAADELNSHGAGVPKGSYGTIDFSQFMNNVAAGRPMYGIVRVKVPLIKELRTDIEVKDDEHEKEDDDGEMDKDGHRLSKAGAMTKTAYSDGRKDDFDHKRYKYKLCGQKPTQKCNLCGPDIGTDLKPGAKICGSTLNKNSKILVYGSIFFDWIDCETKDVIPLENLPESPRDIYFS
ncbi:MAG: hypothetical protein R3240_14330, partial [Gammaproteobacteria bacterium]|nr:hypothetical protein [Gammaproteobacteria bacterium]